MALLQISSNTGPVECCFAVAQIVDKILLQAKSNGLDAAVVELVPGPVPNTIKSALIDVDSGVDDSVALAFSSAWVGSLQWICKSNFRVTCKRKNWFVDGSLFQRPTMLDSEIKYETTKASGPGGQHVNKTESAVRATHVKTGVSVKVQTERSQHANKRLAKRLLEQKIAQINERSESALKSDMRLKHHHAVRGNAVRTFTGMEFKE